MIEMLVHMVLLLMFPPLMLGVINKTKAFFAGRKGVPLLQAYFDIGKLLRKALVISTTTTWIFWAGPVVSLASVLAAGLLLPLGPFNAPISFIGDMILFAYLFGLARFFTTAAALDTGSAFEGMGAAREVTFALLSEPALFFALLVLAKDSGSLSLNAMLHGPALGITATLIAPFVLIAVGLFIIMLAESCRIPVDDPNTHLELTMIHEVMVLDHSGPLLGMVLYGASIKLFELGSIVLHLAVPFQSNQAWINWILFMVELLALSVVVGVIESIMARLRMRHVPNLLIGALLLCGSGFVLLVR
jgi:formate hydrogenlyase subunit 4